MYVGRIVSVFMSKEGKIGAMYRVSSRSFPNREAKINATTVAIVPKPGHEGDIFKNPYIAYNCVRMVGSYAVVTNGSHTDPIAEKLAAGMSMRDALAVATFGMDYEHDHLSTPRISAIVDAKTGKGYLATIRHDALIIKEIALNPGEAFYVATYEHNEPNEKYFDGNIAINSAESACDYILGKGVFADLEKPVTAAAVYEAGDSFEIFVKDAAL
ncbi:MAG: IMP cyclohydrolase [Lentisphaeria bacterium]